MTVPLLPLTAAFFAGRLVSYTIYVTAASLASDSLGQIIGDSLTSPLGIVVQVLMLAGLVALVSVDWRRILRSRPEAAVQLSVESQDDERQDRSGDEKDRRGAAAAG